MTATVPTPTEVSAAGRNPAIGLLRTMRPRQWVKNVLVLAAPFASRDIIELDVIVAVALAFVAFSLAASGVYLVNDVKDVEADRAHPTKRIRPIAAGILAPRVAMGAAVVLFAVSLGVSWLASDQLLVVTAVYIAVQLSYCFWLKHQPVVDIAIVASGFLIRAVAGGAAAEIALSQWFLLVAAFGSLFMVAGKRYSELVLVGDSAQTRKTLREYSASYLRFVWSLSAGVTCTAYSLWAFDLAASQDGAPWATLSIAPFVIGVLRYAVDVDKGAAGAPEEIVMGDKVLLLLGVLWAVLVGVGVFTR